MATEDLQINIGANTQDLQTGLNQATQSITNFGTAVKTVTKPTGDATQSLVNLSRIAQDAPYGFIGIANNLNPMLESFQRLSKESGSAGGALKAMVAGLTGPAGIGLALGVVSSLVVAFGDDISKFVSELVSAGGATKEMKAAISGIGNDFTNAVEKVNKVEIAFAEFHKGILTGEQALKIYNQQLGASLGVKSNINEAEEIFKAKTAAYVEAQLQRALADAASKKAAEELLKQKQMSLTGPENTWVDYVVGIGQGGTTKGLKDVAQKRLADDKAASEEIIKEYKKIAKDAQMAADEIAKTNKIVIDPEKLKKVPKEKDYSLQDNIAALENDTKATMKWADEQMRIHNKMLEFYKKYGDVVKADTSSSRMRDYIEQQDKKREKTDIPLNERKIEIPANIKMMEAGIKKFDNQLESSKESMQKYAEFMSKTLTEGIMVMWDAFEQGKNPLQAVGDYIGDLVKKLAQAAIQAALFQGILMAFGGGGASFGTGFFNGFKKILGMAEGGVVSRPTLAMVGEGGQSEAVMPLNKLGNMMNSTFAAGAMSGTGGAGNGQFVLKGNDLVLALQRSNYSLNLRRGNGI